MLIKIDNSGEEIDINIKKILDIGMYIHIYILNAYRVIHIKCICIKNHPTNQSPKFIPPARSNPSPNEEITKQNPDIKLYEWEKNTEVIETTV